MNDIIRILDKHKGGNSSTLVVDKNGLHRVYKNSENSYLIASSDYGLVRATKSGNSYFITGGKK